MNTNTIETYIKDSLTKSTTINIHFKGRSKVTGLFIRGRDYQELKLKNFWRIVDSTRVEKWSKTKDINLARIFNGASFSALTRGKSPI